MSTTTTGAESSATVGQVLALGAFIATVSGWSRVSPTRGLAVLAAGATVVALLLVLQRWPERPLPGLALLRWTPGPSFTRWSTAATLAFLGAVAALAATARTPAPLPTLAAFWVLWIGTAWWARQRSHPADA